MIRAAPRKPAQASANAIELARSVLRIEADAVHALIDRIDERFVAAVDLIHGRTGRVVVSGMGKSGHIARKIASTLSSTGTTAYFVHPAEASHGDLGMIERGDVFIAISYSGSSAELLEIVPLVKRRGARLIAITGRADSALALQADVHLDARVDQEACPHNLAPTASTTAALALGDALAIVLLDTRGFSAADFAHMHPRGALPDQARARHAVLRVKDVMRSGAAVPSVSAEATGMEAVLEMTRCKMGMTAVVNAAREIQGIFTDGDLRRSLEKRVDFEHCRVRDVMTSSARTIGPGALAVEAVHLMETHKVNQLLVVDEQGRLVGALNTHDLFRAKVI